MMEGVRRKIGLLAITLLLVGCSDALSRQVDFSDTSRAISFCSDRRVQTEHGVMGREGTCNLLLMTHDGGEAAYLKGTGYVSGVDRVTWSPDGDTMVTVAFDYDAGHSCLMLIAADGQRCLVDDTNAREPSWSPDGQWISFSLSRSGSNAIYLVQVSTGEVKKLIDIPDYGTGSVSTWSPDSKQVAYVAAGNPWNYILLVGVSSGNPITLTRGDFPAWSPISNEIAFVRSNDVWIYDVDSGQETVFVDDPETAARPAWSSNGQQLLFQSTRNGNMEIYRVNRDGSGLINLTNNPASDGLPSWRPISNHSD